MTVFLKIPQRIPQLSRYAKGN